MKFISLEVNEKEIRKFFSDLTPIHAFNVLLVIAVRSSFLT